MKKNWKKIGLLLILATAISFYFMSGISDYLTFDSVKEHRNTLRNFVERNYLYSALVFFIAYVSTAFFVPGAIALTLAAGFLFGVLKGVLLVLAAAISGAVFAFLSARYLLGNWVQKKFSSPLKIFNEEIERHGQNYLIVFRIIPVLPFFAVNYLAGITRIPLRRFAWTTAAGMLPGSILYTYAGRRLGEIENPGDLLSTESIIAFSALALLALLPVFVRLWGRLKNRKKS
jgi:uncharacterized membrane protein YdjX (TVP38/TMEM64 family)